MRLSRKIFLFFASLKLAVIVILLLAGVLAWGTFVEAAYGMQGSKALVYGTHWFAGILFLLGVNVFCAAWSRYPWKKTQTGFVVTHAGIITLLIGSVITQQWGVDGNLPVVEGESSAETILSETVISLREEDSKQKKTFFIPAKATKSEDRLLSVKLNDHTTIEIDKYYPRARFNKALEMSPIQGVGYPALELELYNDRFNLEELLLATNPDSGITQSIGPAEISLRQLWSESEVEAFLKTQKAKSENVKNFGTLVAKFQGREFRIPVEQGLRTKRKIGKSQFEISIDRYFSYAIVEDNELVNKSPEHTNPTVQLTVTMGPGKIEKHTVFANFPEFPTRHEKKSEGDPTGLSFSLTSNFKQKTDMGIVGTARGKLDFGVGPDNKLYAHVLSREGKTNFAGEVEAGKTYQTGWMDLNFLVRQYFAHSIQKVEPYYVHTIEGTDGNFLSAIHYRVQQERGTASTSEGWIMEGAQRSFSIDGRRYFLTLGKEELVLPFKIRLEKFSVGKNPGTDKAASYESVVRVVDDQSTDNTDHLISMNEPLTYAGYTFYQASYQLRDNLPPISIFSVNWDPGRWVKYAGSILMCLGIILMFYMNPHYFEKIGFSLRRKPK